MEDFCHKVRYDTQGNNTEAPTTLTSVSVVSRESVRISLTLAALNNLKFKSGDIVNTYLTNPVIENSWIVIYHEFSNDTGKKTILVRALYGIKSADIAFKNHPTDCVRFRV